MQIVDESNNILQDGFQGLIRVKTPYMVDTYYGDAVHIDAFKEGWFYPGDIGCVMNSVVYLTGRSGDVINKGGVKINPAAIEDFSITYPSIEDATVIKVFNDDGGEHAAVLLVISYQRLDFIFLF